MAGSGSALPAVGLDLKPTFTLPFGICRAGYTERATPQPAAALRARDLGRGGWRSANGQVSGLRIRTGGGGPGPLTSGLLREVLYQVDPGGKHPAGRATGRPRRSGLPTDRRRAVVPSAVLRS